MKKSPEDPNRGGNFSPKLSGTQGRGSGGGKIKKEDSLMNENGKASLRNARSGSQPITIFFSSGEKVLIVVHYRQ